MNHGRRHRKARSDSPMFLQNPGQKVASYASLSPVQGPLHDNAFVLDLIFFFVEYCFSRG